MRIAYGTDEVTSTTEALGNHLRDRGHELARCPTEDWPVVGSWVGDQVASGDCDMGVVWCFTGTGVSIAANKVAGVRAALCVDAETARGARRWNDANVLALSIRSASETIAIEIADVFVDTEVDVGESATIAMLEPGTDTE